MPNRVTSLDDYQSAAGETAIYPFRNTASTGALAYLGLKISGEAGEVADNIGKSIRDNWDFADLTDNLIYELGDVLWYVSQIAHELGLPLSHIANLNLDKLADRAERGVISGSGDNR
jgi:NTP pyrophosphatase (non-canonical NTP hydrolase)